MLSCSTSGSPQAVSILIAQRSMTHGSKQAIFVILFSQLEGKIRKGCESFWNLCHGAGIFVDAKIGHTSDKTIDICIIKKTVSGMVVVMFDSVIVSEVLCGSIEGFPQ